MRIAQIAPLHEAVPPMRYGGTERVVHHLTEELVAMGHEVTLFASADSRTSARLVPVCERALRLDPSCRDRNVYHVLQIERVLAGWQDFDIVHFHCDYLHFPLARRAAVPCLTTLHGRLDLADLAPLYLEYRDVALVSISDAQRRPLPGQNWVATVHHGLPEDAYRLGDGKGGYLAFLGRIAPEKRPDRAIEIARRAGLPLKIAAKVDAADAEYFQTTIRPLLDPPVVEFVGEIGEEEKCRFLGDAVALLFPIDWPEPFGLVMIEAMACGTPVIAWRAGSVPEIVEEGLTGHIVETMADAVAAVDRVRVLSRERCREAWLGRFTARRMAADYLAVYDELSGRATPRYLGRSR